MDIALRASQLGAAREKSLISQKMYTLGVFHDWCARDCLLLVVSGSPDHPTTTPMASEPVPIGQVALGDQIDAQPPPEPRAWCPPAPAQHRGAH